MIRIISSAVCSKEGAPCCLGSLGLEDELAVADADICSDLIAESIADEGCDGNFEVKIDCLLSISSDVLFTMSNKLISLLLKRPLSAMKG